MVIKNFSNLNNLLDEMYLDVDIFHYDDIIDENIFNFEFSSRDDLDFSLNIFKKSTIIGWGDSIIYCAKIDGIYYPFSGRQRILMLRKMSEEKFEELFPNGLRINIYVSMEKSEMLILSHSLFIVNFCFDLKKK